MFYTFYFLMGKKMSRVIYAALKSHAKLLLQKSAENFLLVILKR